MEGRALSALERQTDRWLRELARRTSRRGVLARLGRLLCGAAVVPLLPIVRASAGVMPNGEDVAPTTSGDPEHDPGNPRSCEYWRHCAIDGFLCACCGGTQSQCPPGTVMSPVTWIGTCRNPADGVHYVLSYNDCCGKTACNRCFCNRNEREQPVYRPSKSNDIHWCLGTESTAYTCSVAVIVGTSSGEG